MPRKRIYSDEERLKRRRAQQMERYYRLMQDPEYRKKECERSKERRKSETEEQKKRRLESHAQYNREMRALKKELGVKPSEEERLEKNRRQRETYRNRCLNEPAFRKYVRQRSKLAYKRRKERLEEEAFQRRLAMSRAAREILNY